MARLPGGGEVPGQEPGEEQGEGREEQPAGEEKAGGQGAEQGEQRVRQVAAPLADGVDGQDGEQGGQSEVQAGDAVRNEASEQRPDGGARCPVQVQEELQPEDAPAGRSRPSCEV
ncbi:hypothetical protein [Streptomyces bicolor]|uniref:hypothetical protein n=1 Tax=Streptomyces bicolor TaxID=66874 RepID=UPI0004E22787